ncbi:chitin deacetylase [Myxozyma melibiosi]|uniref:chitin deacetylase n=1 Tax=Myxozyma melibiosi TaxID=54550 RepID=A0ABR1F3J8_9ASCO
MRGSGFPFPLLLLFLFLFFFFLLTPHQAQAQAEHHLLPQFMPEESSAVSHRALIFTQPRAEFPNWLREMTGLSRWPGLDAPYVPAMKFDFRGIPEYARYDQQHCSRTYGVNSCSFDCGLCVGRNDIRHCHHLLQTFDDGPTPDTPTLLHYLKSSGSKVSFFVLGIQVVSFPDIFRSMHREGHLLATHTYGHAHLPSLTTREIVGQLQWSIWAMNATAGVIPRFFRPPFGGVDNRVRAIAERLGLTVVVWDLDTNDWRLNDRSRSAAEIGGQIRTWREGGVKGIMLEHDTTAATVEAGVWISKLVGKTNYTVADCRELGMAWYQ